MKILIFGATGMLGHKLYQVLGSKHDVLATIRGKYDQIERFGIFDRERIIEAIDINDDSTVRSVIAAASPDVVINAVGVVKQLPASNDVVSTLRINSLFPHIAAEAAETVGSRFITISTDCVFSGSRGNYSEESVPDALDLYGQSKKFGETVERNALTIRTSIIGRELGTGHSLVEWFLSNRGKRVRGFSNAIYSGFPTVVLADIINDLILPRTEIRGLYHVSSDPINKFELVSLLNEKFGAEATIERYDDFRIDRSLNSDRFRADTEFKPMRWAEMVDKMAEDPTPYDSFHR